LIEISIARAARSDDSVDATGDEGAGGMIDLPGCRLAPFALVMLLAGCASTPVGAQRGRATAPLDPQAPARQLDVVPRQIPALLVAALDDPYASPSRLDCGTLAARIAELDAVLGPDLDAVPHDSRADLSTSRLVFGGIASATPYLGWLRRLTGAERRQRLAQAAVGAGFARRGFLKGLGQRSGCRPPAAPLQVRPSAEALRR
jgi:hypothetical protein